jgi:hypothetical protein
MPSELPLESEKILQPLVLKKQVSKKKNSKFDGKVTLFS